jgi:hypothetical protein
VRSGTLPFFVQRGLWFGGPDAGSRRGDMPESGGRAVGLVAAEDLCGEGRVVAEPSLG